MEKDNMFMSETTELNCSFFNPSWDNSISTDHGINDPFESALSSMVSSPTAAAANATPNGENIVLRELIGRLGSICSSPQPHNSGTTTTTSYNNGNGDNISSSCYSTPLNSPPKLHLSSNQMRSGGQSHFPPSLVAPFSTDPGFVERAARFSCFANKSLGFNEMVPNLDSGRISRVSSNQSIKISSGDGPGISPSDRRSSRFPSPENGESMENSSVSEQIQNDANYRKRKSVPRGKGKDSNTPAKDANGAGEKNESLAKRSKSDDGIGNEKDKADQKQSKDKDYSKAAPEPPKDYIHVRARRGQATDAHSLAERVRREKISERMKVLQDLVPGCNKVTGKAVMLDEIINYVQSLQRQVEFLSMKLATVNPRMDLNMEALMSKDMLQSRGSLPHNMYPSDSYPFQSQPNSHAAMISNGNETPFSTNNYNAGLGRNQLPPMDNFSDASQVSNFWEDDLHSVVQMGFGQNQTQNFHGIMPNGQMKVEL